MAALAQKRRSAGSEGGELVTTTLAGRQEKVDVQKFVQFLAQNLRLCRQLPRVLLCTTTGVRQHLNAEPLLPIHDTAHGLLLEHTHTHTHKETTKIQIRLFVLFKIRVFLIPLL